MTATEKNYSKYLGNLYWQKIVYWNNNERAEDKRLIIVNNLYRKYGESGDYFLQYDILHQPKDYDKYGVQKTFNIRAKRFEEYVKSSEYVVAT